jgi:uncharacterized protein (DUF1330 family)
MSDSKKTYMIVTTKLDMSKEDDLKTYLKTALPIFGKNGAKPVGQYAVVENLIGESENNRVIVVEFPSADSIRNAFNDPEYQAVVPNRDASHPILNVMIAEDFDPAALIKS